MPSNPTASPIATHLLNEGDSIALSSLFTYSDADNDIVSFAVREVAGGYLTYNGNRMSHNQLYDEQPISEIGNWRFVAGSDTGTVRFNAIDSRGAFNPSATATINVREVEQSAPTASPVATHLLDEGDSIALSSLFTYSDADNDIVSFAVREVAGGYLTYNGNRMSHNQLYDEQPISEIGNWRFVAGSDTGTVRFNAIDSRGAFNPSATATINVREVEQSAPTASPVATHLLDEGDSIALSSLFTYSDADNDIVSFAVREVAGGYLTYNGNRMSHNQLYDEQPISEIGNWRFVAGSDTGTVRFNAIDSRGAFNPSATATINVREVEQSDPINPNNDFEPNAFLDDFSDWVGLGTNAYADFWDAAIEIILDGIKEADPNGARFTQLLLDNLLVGPLKAAALVLDGGEMQAAVQAAEEQDGLYGATRQSLIEVINLGVELYVTGKVAVGVGLSSGPWGLLTGPLAGIATSVIYNTQVEPGLKALIGQSFDNSLGPQLVQQYPELFPEQSGSNGAVVYSDVSGNQTYEGSADADTFNFRAQDIGHDAVVINGPDTIQLSGDGWVVLESWNGMVAAATGADRSVATNIAWTGADDAAALFNLSAPNGGSATTIHNDVSGNQTYEGSANADTFNFRAQDTGHDAVVINGPDTIQLSGDGWVVLESWNGMVAAATGADRSVATNIAWTGADDAAALFNLSAPNGGSATTIHNDVSGNQTYEGSANADTFNFRAQDTGHDAVVINGPDTIQLSGDGWVVLESWNGMVAAATGADRSVATNIAWTGADDAAALFNLSAPNGGSATTIHNDVSGNQTYEGSADADTFNFRAQDIGHDAVVINGPDTIQLSGDGWVVLESWNGMVAAATGADRSIVTNIEFTTMETAEDIFGLL